MSGEMWGPSHCRGCGRQLSFAESHGHGLAKGPDYCPSCIQKRLSPRARLPDPPSNPRLAVAPLPPRTLPPDTQNPNVFIGKPIDELVAAIALGIVTGIVTGTVAFCMFGIGR